jgi:hypothetical protein
MNAEDIIKRFEKSVSYRQNWENLYSSAYEHFMPQRSKNFKDSNTDGQNNDGADTVFDSTPLDSLNKFVSKLQTSLVPAQKNWVKLKVGSSIEDNREELQAVLDKITDVFFSAIRNSNFDVEASESFYDLAVGTACLMMQEGDVLNPFKFKTVPLSELYLEKVGNGQYNSIFRKHRVIPMFAEKVWPDAKVNKDLLSDEKEEDFVEAVIQEKEGWKYYVVCSKDKSLVVQRTLRYNPFIVFRWSVMPGEVYGRGPVLFALPDAKSLNKTKELILKNASIAVSGVWTAEDDGIVNTNNIQIKPGAIISVTSNGGASRAASLQALQTGTNFNVGDMVISDLRQSISNIMFANPLGPVDQAVKTATEIEYRQKQYADEVGAPFGRLESEFIKPIIQTGLLILDSLGKIDIKDFRVNEEQIAVDYASPLSITQNTEDVNKLIKFMEVINGIFGPQIAAALLNVEVIPTLATKMGIDLNNIKTADEIKQLQEQAQTAMLQQIGGADGGVQQGPTG